jgi:hypothetical protein
VRVPGIDPRLGFPPVLPDTCISVTYSDVPVSRYALVLRGRAEQEKGTYASWVLEDRQSHSALATLTTSDGPPAISASSLQPLDGSRLRDCRTPHTMIADRLFGAVDGQLPQYLQKIEVSTRVRDDLAKPPQMLVPAVESEIELSANERLQLFHPELSKEAWKSAVERARSEGVANFGPLLLRWADRQLLELVPPRASAMRRGYALREGFAMVDSSRSWYDSEDNLLERYAADGTLQWQVRISTPRRTVDCHKFWPQAVYVSGEHLVLADQCQSIAEQTQGKAPHIVTWSVPLNRLPGRL